MSTDLREGPSERAIRREQAVGAGLALAVCLAAALALSSGTAKSLQVSSFPFAPIAMAWAIFDLLTASFLFARFSVSGRPVFGWVGAAYGCSGLLTLSYLAAYLGLFGTAAKTLGDQQIEGALYTAWHALFATLVPIGILLDARRPQRESTGRSTVSVWPSVAATVAGATLISVAVYAWRDRLPVFALDGVMEPSLSHAMLFVVGLSGAALTVVLVVCRHRLYGYPLWLCVALLTSTLEAALNSASLVLFSVAWDVGKLLTLATSSFVMVRVLVTVLRMYTSISEIMALRSHDAAARLRAIWRIATSEGLGEHDHLQLVLDVATSNIRSLRPFFGVLGRLDEGSVLVTAVSRFGDPAVHERASQTYRVDARVPLTDGVYAALHAAGGTLIWQPPIDVPGELAARAGWRTAIGTVIQVGVQTHFLVFGTPDRLDADRLVEADVAFVEVVASIVNRRYFASLQLERLHFQAEHDPLTGTYNRTIFRRLGRVATAGNSLRAVVLIDLDAFAEVNHRHGQMTGDAIIVEVAAALSRVDQRDVVARVAGDEFAVLVQSAGGSERDLAESFAAYERIFQQPFSTGDREGKEFVAVTASLGIALVDEGQAAFEPLLSRAAVALEHAKTVGGSTTAIFGPELEALFNERSLERAELIDALDTNALFLEYQPTFELNTGTVTGAEALVRWQHPTRGVVRPDVLLPAIQRANLLRELTYWVMRQVARDFGGAGLPHGFRCFINTPAQVLDSESFVNTLNQILVGSPGLAEHLGIEVTESEVMHRVERAIETLARVRTLGLVVAVDDFGTGYSSLNYLKRLPVDVLKLDKTFIDGLPDDPKDVALADVFLALSKQFGFASVGEGIETEAQAEWLRSHGCMIGQGFLYSKPIAHAALMNLVRESPSQTPRPI